MASRTGLMGSQSSCLEHTSCVSLILITAPAIIRLSATAHWRYQLLNTKYCAHGHNLCSLLFSDRKLVYPSQEVGENWKLEHSYIVTATDKFLMGTEIVLYPISLIYSLITWINAMQLTTSTAKFVRWSQVHNTVPSLPTVVLQPRLVQSLRSKSQDTHTSESGLRKPCALGTNNTPSAKHTITND